MKRVLILENDQKVVTKLTTFLEAKGCIVTNFTCTDGYKQLLEAVRDIKPDVVISGIQVPNIDGRDICRFLKNHDTYGRIPIVLVVPDTHPARSTILEADVVLAKPLDEFELNKTYSGLMGLNTDEVNQVA